MNKKICPLTIPFNPQECYEENCVWYGVYKEEEISQCAVWHLIDALIAIAHIVYENRQDD